LKPLRQAIKVMQINLAEEPIAPLRIGDDGGISIFVSGHEVVSIMFLP